MLNILCEFDEGADSRNATQKNLLLIAFEEVMDCDVFFRLAARERVWTWTKQMRPRSNVTDGLAVPTGSQTSFPCEYSRPASAFWMPSRDPTMKNGQGAIFIGLV